MTPSARQAHEGDIHVVNCLQRLIDVVVSSRDLNFHLLGTVIAGSGIRQTDTCATLDWELIDFE